MQQWLGNGGQESLTRKSIGRLQEVSKGLGRSLEVSGTITGVSELSQGVADSLKKGPKGIPREFQRVSGAFRGFHKIP